MLQGPQDAVIGGVMPMSSILVALQRDRPVFHSEADFQHALAWALHQDVPAARIRLETRFGSGQRLDLLVLGPNGVRTGIELKYLCTALDAVVDSERFVLPKQGAQDIRGYDVLHDVERLERAVDDGEFDDGVVVVLTNDSSFWRRPAHGRATGAAAFRLYEGETVSGERAWGAASAGTAKHRPEALHLRGSYVCSWSDYSALDCVNGAFRVLVLPVSATRPAI